MNLFVALLALLVVAAAAPEADPYYLLHPYLLDPHAKTADLVTHPNGAVVPTDTVSVQAARAGHLATKALYGYGWPYAHYLGKREAEAEPKADADPYLLYGGYGYPYHHPAITSIGAFTTYTNGAVVPTNTPAVAAATASHLAAKAADYAAHGYGYGLLYGRKKREAESNAEADPFYFYGLYGHYPYGHYPAVTSVGALTTYSNGAVVPTDPANQAATAAHLAGKGLVHYLGKRDAEADADPYYFYGLYGHHYGHPVASAVGGFTTYSNGAVVPTDPANLAATAQHLAYKGAHYAYGYPYGVGYGYGYWG